MADVRKVGDRTIFSAGYDPDEVVARFSAAELVFAKIAHENGNPAALGRAVRFLNQEQPDEPYPEWVRQAIEQRLTTPQKPRRPGGRPSKNLIDYVRWEAVARLLHQGASKREATSIASKHLGGTAAGTPKVMAQSYQRVRTRLPRNMLAYYPLFDPMTCAVLFDVPKKK